MNTLTLHHVSPRRVGRCATAALALAASVALLGACGGGGDPGDTESPTPSAPHSPAAASSSSATASPSSTLAGPGDKCGVVTMPGGDRFRLTVHKGKVDCAQARKVFKTYLTKLRRGEAPGNGGGGPVHVQGWTCVSGTAVHPGSSCRKDTASFAAKPL